MKKLTMNTQNKIKFWIIVLIISRVLNAEVSHRIILEGFQNAKIGYEIDLSRWQLKLLGAVNSLSENNVSITSELYCGRIVRYYSDLEINSSISIESQLSKRDLNTNYENISVMLLPSLNTTLYKLFKKFIIGGGVQFNLWQIQKSKSELNNTGWYIKRQFSINPHFIIGFEM